MVSYSVLKGLNREDRIRTCDPLVPNQVLYQAELIPDNAPNRSRTCNRLIRSQVLYPIELWVQILFNCIENAEGRGRTGTVITDRRILSPVRLPIPPPRHYRTGKAEDGIRTRDPHHGKVMFYH